MDPVLPLDRMTVEEKFGAMEMLWDENHSIFVSLACIRIEPITLFWLALATGNR